ncbi:cobyric acid synthase [Limosilactobacillus reuteri]|uniref:cobyric acid synthase n=1 Tax=Limosilactobacillus reuteri TaxID=1598 RepID=UPI000C1B7536|nr:cobyric acid synthase [Limosilactobacillus reuteri]PIN30294.1 cobyric acid synthase CobQ [Limosilactobacillus reuteri]PUH34430.1 cobyric acid synthase [Limosilactobacillus reuteri]PUH34454.1 cobyric acid synthase [Limosilactobacillus reuteri]WLC95642.1 cobyric acid synthase [Limosilactobacillus reuteri]WRH77787.1 cobyric acid synthase [Limosilactobacillus reuteri]
MAVQSVMFQGTASDAGKSWLAAAVCRILANRGQKVVPFKSQNMALNSFITDKGDEMGRAQVFQAEAARVKPDVRMNPILLKPSTDKDSQVIVMGKVLEDMDAVSYYHFKRKLIPQIMAAYNTLATENDVVVLEGAGSPAEINLNENDIVNMGMAKMADAPVILVADIDKGGVFASIYGTIKLMSAADQQRIKGIIINKFRGDKSLLEPGNKMIEELTGIPVIGVLPMSDIDIDEEDSVSLSRKPRRKDIQKDLDVAVIDLNKISNFTDIHSLKIQPDVSVRYVLTASELGTPDLLILPGSKNTNEDLAALRKNGLADAIMRAHRDGSRVVGICGGYQILGRMLHDPTGIESPIKEQEGLGLLDTETTFNEEKTTTQAVAKRNNYILKGYEIHMGTTKLGPNATPFSTIKETNGQSENREDGAINNDGTVIGTYLHGIFDNPYWTRHLLNRIRAAKGMAPLVDTTVSISNYKDQQYEKLAQLFAQNVDMEKFDQILQDSTK